MASSARKKKTAIATVRKGPNPQIVKLKTRLAAASKRASSAAKDKESGLIAIGAAAGLAMLEKRNTKLPTVMGLDPAFTLGAVLFLGGPKIAGGKNGKRLESAGEGLLAVAANRSILRGSLKVAGEDDDDDDEDEDEDDEG